MTAIRRINRSDLFINAWCGQGADVACRHSLKRKLRELYHYTALVTTGLPPEPKYCSINDEPDENEARFLDENDITK
jgi:hypothetical protein